MVHIYCEYEDCGAPILVRHEEVPKQHGAYAYDCPVCRRGIRIGVVSRFLPISPPGGARGGKVLAGQERVGTQDNDSSGDRLKDRE